MLVSVRSETNPCNPAMTARRYTPTTNGNNPMAIHEVPITKAGKSAVLTVDDSRWADETILALIALGLKTALNSGMTKVTGLKDLEGEALAAKQAEALEIAKKNLAALAEGKFKFPGTKPKSAEGRDVVIEAMKEARNTIRDRMRSLNIPMNSVPAKDITVAAKELIESDESFYERAKARLAERAKAPAPEINLEALGIKVDFAAIEAKKAAADAKRKESLSAAQAKRTKKVAGTTKVKPKSAPDLGAILGSKGGQGQSPHTAH